MLFYKIQGILITDHREEQENKEEREAVREICIKSENFNSQNDKNSYYFIIDSSNSVVTVGAITDCADKLSPAMSKFLRFVELPLRDITVTEITFNALKSFLRTAYRADYIDDDDTILEKFNLDKIDGRNSIEFGENIVDYCKKEELLIEAEKYLMNDTLIPELERIYAGKAQARVSGHPVHYMVETDDRDTRREVYKMILDALYANGRLESKRYTFLDVIPGESFSLMSYDALYKSCAGGAVVVRYIADDRYGDEDIVSEEIETIANLCKAAKQYRNDVLTVFCLPRECKKMKVNFFENLGTISLVELKEDLVQSDRARKYLKMLAQKKHIRADKKLFLRLETDKMYLATELKGFFEEWYNNKLKTSVYPQYKEISAVEHEVIKAKPKGSAYDELNEMIGLNEAKGVIKKALNYYKMQKIYQTRGVKEDHPAMHMIFTGNPGTAKTTVARLFARIMRENGLLSKGHLVEVGRGDLVGKYVGWTAPTVQAKFKAAKGGVLFIDEAYSLVDDRDGSYGDEAINTIVQEMENHREDVVVIFAGYPDKMECFLQKNPGLRSRIAFHVPFADYSTEELCEIARHIGRAKGMSIDDGAIDKLKILFDTARLQGDFGNGRYVRNVFEQAKMNQASRLMEFDLDTIGDREISTIMADDIVVPSAAKTNIQRKIGFC